MKASEIKVGGVYIAKVSNKLTRVRVDAVQTGTPGYFQSNNRVRYSYYGRGTYTVHTLLWGCFVKARAICPDGKARVVKLSLCADTFSTVPAKVTYRGKTVCGFITFESADGLSTNPEQWVKFVPTGCNAYLMDPKRPPA